MDMIKLIILVLMLAASNGLAVMSVELPSKFVHALNMVEAGGKRSNVEVGDGGKAIGPFQIHRAYWQDAVEHDSTIKGKYEDCQDYTYSVKVISAYMHRYAFCYIKSSNYQAAARIHNGGPKGYSKQATLKYWQKVEKFL